MSPIYINIIKTYLCTIEGFEKDADMARTLINCW